MAGAGQQHNGTKNRVVRAATGRGCVLWYPGNQGPRCGGRGDAFLARAGPSRGRPRWGAGFWPTSQATSREKAEIAGSRDAGSGTMGHILGEEMPGNQQPKFGAKRTRIERDTRVES